MYKNLYEAAFILPKVLNSELILEEDVNDKDFKIKGNHANAEFTLKIKNENNIYNMLKWHRSIWNPESGLMNHKADLIGNVVISQHDRVGNLIKRITFQAVQITEAILNNDFLQASFISDYCIEEHIDDYLSKPENKNMLTMKEEAHSIISHLLKIDDANLFKCIELLHYFIDKYPDAPGSSSNHQAFNGGYYKHVNDILNYAIVLYNQLGLLNKLTFKLSDALLVLFLHDIEKPVKYCSKTLETDKEIRSRLIYKFGIVLSEEHLMAMKYIHGEGEDYRKDQRIMSPLCAFCHCCDVISARIFFN
jgi:hypothetical protein